ncbi:hypothetical protein SAMN04488105_1308 [Salipiger thiooxidans]|uniref:Uncharacterized protein n=1 Tax=Salipiger thiooxidans TaxID=282683 RepID=A0A1G7M5W5_9RHOB|nr:hypothetical protein [Salipiger thiooxidans]SDF57153.1 hypothetical protein SAMN04488105_1308 [Salipiger thiooxidans]
MRWQLLLAWALCGAGAAQAQAPQLEFALPSQDAEPSYALAYGKARFKLIGCKNEAAARSLAQASPEEAKELLAEVLEQSEHPKLPCAPGVTVPAGGFPMDAPLRFWRDDAGDVWWALSVHDRLYAVPDNCRALVAALGMIERAAARDPLEAQPPEGADRINLTCGSAGGQLPGSLESNGGRWTLHWTESYGWTAPDNASATSDVLYVLRLAPDPLVSEGPGAVDIPVWRINGTPVSEIFSSAEQRKQAEDGLSQMLTGEVGPKLDPTPLGGEGRERLTGLPALDLCLGSEPVGDCPAKRMHLGFGTRLPAPLSARAGASDFGEDQLTWRYDPQAELVLSNCGPLVAALGLDADPGQAQATVGRHVVDCPPVPAGHCTVEVATEAELRAALLGPNTDSGCLQSHSRLQVVLTQDITLGTPLRVSGGRRYERVLLEGEPLGKDGARTPVIRGPSRAINGLSSDIPCPTRAYLPLLLVDAMPYLRLHRLTLEQTNPNTDFGVALMARESRVSLGGVKIGNAKGDAPAYPVSVCSGEVYVYDSLINGRRAGLRAQEGAQLQLTGSAQGKASIAAHGAGGSALNLSATIAELRQIELRAATAIAARGGHITANKTTFEPETERQGRALDLSDGAEARLRLSAFGAFDCTAQLSQGTTAEILITRDPAEPGALTLCDGSAGTLVVP